MTPELVEIPRTRLELFREVDERLSCLYPFLKLEMSYRSDNAWNGCYPIARESSRGDDLLKKDVALIDAMTVPELENTLEESFGSKITVLRKNGTFWVSAAKPKSWTLRQHNDHGHYISLGVLINRLKAFV